MATAKKNDSDALEKLSGDVDALRADLSALVDSLKQAGITEGKEALSKAEREGDRLRAELSEASALAESSVQGVAAQAQKMMKEQPLTAVLIAAVAGLALGFASKR